MRKNFSIAAFLLIIIIFFTVNPASCNTILRFMTGPDGGNWFNLGETLAKIWTRAGIANIKTNNGGGVSNILNIHARRCDIAFSVLSLFKAAINGEADFKGRSVDNAMLMTNLYTQYTYFIMRREFAERNNIKSLDDVISKKIPVRFATLKPGTSSEFIVKAIFDKGYGIDYKTEIRKWGGTIEYVSYEGGTELLLDRNLDLFAFSAGKTLPSAYAATYPKRGGKSPVITNIDSKLDVVLLSVDDDALKKLSEAYGTVTLNIEPNNNAGPVRVVGDYTCLVVRKDLPEELIYNLNKAIWDNRDEIIKAAPDMREFIERPSIRWISGLEDLKTSSDVK